jgi:hypothetical protein
MVPHLVHTILGPIEGTVRSPRNCSRVPEHPQVAYQFYEMTCAIQPERGVRRGFPFALIGDSLSAIAGKINGEGTIGAAARTRRGAGRWLTVEIKSCWPYSA